ncbi:flagellar hook-associated 2 domain-containing protein [Sulfuricurvum kujiense DSM 16994]|uniref:Flagellar hook-associated protein 2 n=1 Tax=Sulfuricurvum kujiense (strain ATCC BAA-921 / DSM 16994 / JCM 11577 / YK-1) TaxID=709032 RepID=E4TXB8_SULKY|nr:flagellar filament capping protein FliD [Sulfuricurvum kujiense]ADR32815.1 flagellar hook-associated 2 domain-containing protein [Sulfuricurvum kujiense DSM 16994]
MSGTINSLGLGSGVLTADLIDKLKASDEAVSVTPFDSKISLNKQKSQALDLLNSLLTTFKSSVNALDNDSLYQKRSVSGTNDGVSVSASAGSQIRDFSIGITNIAKKNVVQSASFSSNTDKIANTDGKLNLNISGKNYTIDYTATTTLDDIKQSINDAAGSDVSASVLQTGTSAYSLVVTSKVTGKEQTISLTDISGNLKNNNLVSEGVASGSFIAADDFIANTGAAGTMSVNVGGVGYNFAYDDTTTLEQMVDNINNDSTLSGKISASIVQYGANDYRMVLTPKDGTEGSAITITDTPSSGTGLVGVMTGTTDKGGLVNTVQNGQDASFTFDGIAMTRSTNTITDIATGLTINLLQDGGSSNISISQDRDQIATELEGLVSSYNTLQQQLDSMLSSDSEAGTVGIFNGDNTIRNIGREITKMINSVDSKGSSLANYGIDLTRDGTMTFDKSVFTEKMDADPEGTEAFFSGKTTVNSVGSETYTKGVFTTLSDLMTSYVGSSGTVTNLVTDTKSATTSLNEERAKAVKLLEARYATLTAKFAAYDSMISKLNSQFSALQQQIDAAANANN